MKTSKIIGTFKGKCCDSEEYNNNGMFLNRDLFNNLINSDEYKTAMKNRYYIGFLGHPEDPNCMDFRNACIIMTDMEMLDNGEIWGTFDLVDTPVGRVVKSFIDAGVVFGISIRGAGDIDASGVVDPDTFVFRGYDLVTFPAYNDAVPEFKAIAASSDINKQSKYKKVCITIKNNLSKIQSCEALEVMQSQFNENSSEYQNICDRIDELSQGFQTCENCSLLQQKLDAMTNLYLEQVTQNRKLFEEMNRLKLQLSTITSNSSRKIKSLKRITSSQISRLEKELTSVENKYMTLVSANSKLKDQNQKYISACEDLRSHNQNLKSSNQDLRSYNHDLESQIFTLEDSVKSLKRDNRQIKSLSASVKDSESNIQQLEDTLSATQKELKDVKNSNLIYKKKIESTNNLLAQKDQTISGLQSQLRETVTANEEISQESLNRDETVKNLKQEISNHQQTIRDYQNIIEECQQMIEDYQQSYADICASAVGVSIDNIPVTGKTTAKELRNLIFSSTSTSGMGAKPSYAKPEQLEMLDDEEYYDDRLVSL